MLKQCFAYCQYILPQHLITSLVGKLANSTIPIIKNTFIKVFIKLYNIDMSEALEENPEKYQTFNDFFIRKLKPAVRPIATDIDSIISCADGKIAQMGTIQQNQLLQAKGRYFSLESLLGDPELAQYFQNGHFSTIYLAPNNYHRFHMPIAGKLTKSIYIPGQLFSVNGATSATIPNLYSRNERLVTIFETEIGPIAIILVGAMIVGSIQTVWMTTPIKGNSIKTETFTDGIHLEKGAELGCFKLGSTVVLLFGKDKIAWESELTADSPVQFGQKIGCILK